MKGYREPVMALERSANPRFVEFNATESLSKSDVKALLIYSDNDTMCKRVHFDLLRESLEGKDNVRLMLVSGKGHNPNYTADAVAYLGQYVAQKNKLLRRGKLKDADEKAKFVASFDWNRMTAQDESVWAEIFNHLDS